VSSGFLAKPVQKKGVSNTRGTNKPVLLNRRKINYKSM
jgi:hypothetical protein